MHHIDDVTSLVGSWREDIQVCLMSSVFMPSVLHTSHLFRGRTNILTSIQLQQSQQWISAQRTGPGNPTRRVPLELQHSMKCTSVLTAVFLTQRFSSLRFAPSNYSTRYFSDTILQCHGKTIYFSITLSRLIHQSQRWKASGSQSLLRHLWY